MRNTTNFVMCLNNYQTNSHLPRLSHRVAATTIWRLQSPLLGSPPYGTVLFVAALLLGSRLPESSVTMLTNVAFSLADARLSDALRSLSLYVFFSTYHRPASVPSVKMDFIGTLSRQLRLTRCITCYA